MEVQVLSYLMMKSLNSEKKIEKILTLVKKGDIVMLEGRLHPDEELSLTSSALKNVSGKFSGIEIAYLSSVESKSFIDKLKHNIAKFLLKDRLGITVVGPSKIVKEIKMDPDKLEILLK